MWLAFLDSWWLGDTAFLPETVMRLIEIQMRFQLHSSKTHACQFRN
jgi:hypothetical protein